MKDYPYQFLLRLEGGQRSFIRRASKKFKTSEAGVVRMAIMNFQEDYKKV